MNDKIHFPVEPRHKIKGILMTRDKNAKHKNPYHGKGRSLIGLIREKNHMKVKDHPFFEMSKKTNFANVDLDIYTRSPLESLAAAFGKKVILHYVGREKGRYSMHLCLNSDAKSADTLIRSVVALVKKLPKPARKIWDNALSREFNIGIEAGTRPRAFELCIQTRTLEAVVQVNGRIGITIYAAQV